MSHTQDQIVTDCVTRGKVDSIYQAIDVAFSFSACLQLGFDGSAFVDVSIYELPPFFLMVPNGVVEKFRCVDQSAEIGMRISCVQSEPSANQCRD
ncbi:hypothetical protein D3C72_1936960 [compost metagenome]